MPAKPPTERYAVKHDLSLGSCIVIAVVLLVLAAAIFPRVDCALGIQAACDDIRTAREAKP